MGITPDIKIVGEGGRELVKTDKTEALFFLLKCQPLYSQPILADSLSLRPFCLLVFWEREILTPVASLDRGLGWEEGTWGSARRILYLEIISLA